MTTQNIWAPIEMLDLRRFKEAIVSYGMHSPYVKQMLNSWSAYNRIVPQDWWELAQAVLEPSQRLQWLTWFKDEAKNIEKQWRDKGIQVCQDQLIGGQYASAQTQCLYDVQTLILCRTAALNAWDRVEEPGKKTESFTKVVQGPKESFTDFLQRLASAVKRMVPDSEASKIIIESLTFENANAACKTIIRPLKARSVPLEDWIRDTVNVEAHEHDDMWVAEAISKGLRNVRCFGCGKQGHLKRDCTQVIPRKNVSSRNNGNRMPLPSGVCRRCGKGKHWTNEYRSTRDRQGNPLPQSSGNSQRGLMQAPIANPVQTFPAVVEETPTQSN
ncbi:endogenous retrovirus group K member 10 Gag polyprotein-like [Peromyscus californicus insignis]|uniref:endogenous retrovirus group K member 10 Gag polyprotein-like n=1 Tax=Peromyscus californicus insignis TaxID=564181 RepID=UPI0022A66ED1|nr:endogenous retrovirus group K member 10 Gag polyprotein-like [Peromyscus californicus insignis]XP_052568118.1 endogenous retrovirus group K member 10 Gag polyprotein-like [Peromyscus californicus insignis]XP_052568119.1 endogenous retrovirus group K member 10 Gag polyprotein-like [Peromyscus californicus insignis]